MLITLARKPLTGSVVQNVLAHGCGALNVDACRVRYQSQQDYRRNAGFVRTTSTSLFVGVGISPATSPVGRWPANVLHDGSDAVLMGFPQAVGNHGGRIATSKFQFGAGNGAKISATNAKHDSGSAARFFKQVKGN